MRADNTAVSELGRAGPGGSRYPRKSGAYLLVWVLVVLIGSSALVLLRWDKEDPFGRRALFSNEARSAGSTICSG